MKFDGKTVAAELKALRVKNGLSVDIVCKNVDINRTTLYKSERDASKLRLYVLEELLNFYGINSFIFFKMISEYSHNKGE